MCIDFGEQAALAKERDKNAALKKAFDAEVANHKTEIAEMDSDWQREVKELKEKLRQARQ